MAIFKGTFEEYNTYIGPRIRNRVQYICRNDKRLCAGKCEKCGVFFKTLEAAHIKGKGRKDIVKKVFDSFKRDGDVVECDLTHIETAILKEHYPIKNSFKFLCRACHREYDREVVNETGIKEQKHRQKKRNTSEFEKLHKIEIWAKKTHQSNHKIIRTYLTLSPNNNGVSINSFIGELQNRQISEGNKEKIKGHLSSMKTDSGKSHGKCFYEENGKLFLYNVVYKEVTKWFYLPNIY